MEAVFEQLIKESSLLKFTEINKASNAALELLSSQDGLLKCPHHELRNICLSALQNALESRNSKLTGIATVGYIKLVRDNQYYSPYKEEDESLWLSNQLLTSLNSLPSHTDDVQVDLFKALLNMTIIPGIYMSGQFVTQLLEVCGLAFGRGNSALCTAAQTAASQAVTVYVRQLKHEHHEAEEMKSQITVQTSDDENEFIAPVYDNLVPVINFVSDKLTEAHKQKEDKKGPDIPAIFLLECTSSLLKSISYIDKTKVKINGEPCVHSSSVLVAVVWQRLCPSLIALLGSPMSSHMVHSSGRSDGQMGRGSGCAAHPGHLFNNQQSRAIYNVACGLVVAMGGVGEMRPVLESLFYRMLLYPPLTCRRDALKSISELVSSPDHLVQLAGPIIHVDSRNPYQSDLALFRLVMDSLTECATSSDAAIQSVVIECISNLLNSIGKICEGNQLPPEHIQVINNEYKNLIDGDYKGPLTYENKCKLPKFIARQTEKEARISKSSAASKTSRTSNEDDSSWKEDSVGISEDCQADEDSDNMDCASVEGDFSEDSTSDDQENSVEDNSEHLKDLEEETIRLKRLNDKLAGSTIGHKLYDEETECERTNAKHFIHTLQSLLPSILAIRSTIEVDQAMLEFSSKYCEGVYSSSVEGESNPIIINADGIYMTSYSVLALNLKLIEKSYYNDPDVHPVMTKDQFVNSIHGSGVLVYLSTAWLQEVYDQVIKINFLKEAGYCMDNTTNFALINLLTGLDSGKTDFIRQNKDLDGLGSIEHGSQFLSDHRRLEKAAFNISKSPEVIAGLKLSRRILTCGWESMISILGVILKDAKRHGGIVAPLKSLLRGTSIKEKLKNTQEVLSSCLKCLQISVGLADKLGLQNRCGIIFSLLSSACLPEPSESIVNSPRHRKNKSLALSKKSLKLHKAHVLSVHVMMTSGLELGSHAPECWPHLLRCCVYLADLEHQFFSNNSGYQSFPRFSSPANKNNEMEDQEELYCEERPQYAVSLEPITSDINMEEFISDNPTEVNSSGYLSLNYTGKALFAISQLVDRLFLDAGNKLNLKAFLNFLSELCAASQSQLFKRTVSCPTQSFVIPWPKKKKSKSSDCPSITSEDTLLLHRLSEVMLRLARSGRPLIHSMKAWAIAGPHFMEAACHKDPSVSKEAVTSIHDIVFALLSNQNELPHFHFNEALFKPFENLLCLELCDMDVQDQIVSSICEFVESSTPDIRSGWRPLFGALRCVRPPSSLPSPLVKSTNQGEGVIGHLRVVRDVFEAFLSTDNVLAFANAALDCILCLLKHVKGAGDQDDQTEKVVDWEELVGADMCLNALRYLHRCAMLLASLFMMPSCPVFHSAHRIMPKGPPQIVDSHLPKIDEDLLWNYISKLTGPSDEKISYRSLWPLMSSVDEAVLSRMDQGSGVLHVWYVLLEGMCGATMVCSRRHQPHVLDTLFALLRGLPSCPGADFGMYCINHLLLPMMQSWLRRSYTVEMYSGWELAPCFKQYTGLTSDLVVEYLRLAHKKGNMEGNVSAKLMLQQCLVVLIECITHTSETISRLGCACIRHIANSCGSYFPASYWDVIVCAFHRAAQVSLYPLHQLMDLFNPDSPNFYGDVGQVKVAVRRDCTGKDSDRLTQLSHQVFLLETQQCGPLIGENPDAEDRSFIFLLYPDGNSGTDPSTPSDVEPIRVPFRSIVVGLLANQSIVQTLGMLLVQGSPHIIPSLANVIFQSSNFATPEDSLSNNSSQSSLPGLLQYISHSNIKLLLHSLHLTYTIAVQFDHRPGLKFLVQKVAQAERAANLYKLAGACWTLRMVTLFDLTLSQVKKGYSVSDVKKCLDITNKNDKTCHNVNEKEVLPAKPTTLLNESSTELIVLLNKSFKELCDVYLDLVIDKNGKYSALDHISDEPLFFLTVQPDEFPTEHRKNLEEWTRSLEEFSRKFDDKIKLEKTRKTSVAVSESSVCRDSENVGDKKEINKPFSLSDFIQNYSSDSDDSSPEDERREDSGVASLNDTEQSVYKVATEKDIANVVKDYRKRKNCHSIPSRALEKRANPFIEETPSQPQEPVPPEIHEERTTSLMKDSEAHVRVWTEMVVTVFDLISQLSDSDLRPLLPIIFPTMRSLTAHAHDPHLRQVVAELLNRVADLYGFSPSE